MGVDLFDGRIRAPTPRDLAATIYAEADRMPHGDARRALYAQAAQAQRTADAEDQRREAGRAGRARRAARWKLPRRVTA